MSAAAQHGPRRAAATTNASALPHYLAPYAAYVVMLAAPASLMPRPWAYAAALVAGGAALWLGRRHYLPLAPAGWRPSSVLVGLAAGLAGTALWVGLKAPFYPSGGAPWAASAFWARTVASSTVVPVFEELLFRGFLLLATVQWTSARAAGAVDPLGAVLHERSVRDEAPGTWTALAVVVSSLAFAAGHAPGEWLAATAYGVTMSWLWAVRKDLVTPAVAHGVTNLTLALWVRTSGHWALW